MIYFIVFLISVFFVYLASKSSSNKLLVFMFSAFAVIVPAVLAGLRDYGIGTDTVTYVNDVYTMVCSTPSLVQVIVLQVAGLFGQVEMGYVLLNYLTSFLGKDYHWIYFTTNALLLVVSYLCIYKNRKNLSMPVAWSIFLFFYYNLCLNMVRQSIAIAFCLAAICAYERKKKVLTILFVILSCMSHGTGLMAIAVILLLRYIPKLKKLLGVRKLLALSFFTSICFAVFYKIVFSILLAHGVLGDRYSNYIADDNPEGVGAGGAFQTSYMLVYFVFLYIMVKIYRLQKNKYIKEKMFTYIMMFIIGIMLCWCSVITYHAYRMSFYFLLSVLVIYLPRTLKLYRRKTPKVARKTLVMNYYGYVSVILFLSAFSWFFTQIYKGYNDTYPYTSKLLDSFF